MNFLSGIRYNFRGLVLGFKTPKLLFLGTIRFLGILFLTILAASLIFVYHQEILNLIWNKPASIWIRWLWYLLSWILSLFLVGISAIFSYLISQLLFSVLIMDIMSRVTESMVTGNVQEPKKPGFWNWAIYLIKQEIPRTVIPLLISLIILVAGWVLPLGIIASIISSIIAMAFLSWDNTDLVPARRMLPFKTRFRMFSKSLFFHLGFGLPFLIPGANMVFLSFAPVGATLYHLEKEASQDSLPTDFHPTAPTPRDL